MCCDETFPFVKLYISILFSPKLIYFKSLFVLYVSVISRCTLCCREKRRVYTEKYLDKITSFTTSSSLVKELEVCVCAIVAASMYIQTCTHRGTDTDTHTYTHAVCTCAHIMKNQCLLLCNHTFASYGYICSSHRRWNKKWICLVSCFVGNKL